MPGREEVSGEQAPLFIAPVTSVSKNYPTRINIKLEGKEGRRQANTFAGNCPKSPHKNHELISEKKQYVCKFCKRKQTTPFAGNCHKSPHKNHELMD